MRRSWAIRCVAALAAAWWETGALTGALASGGVLVSAGVLASAGTLALMGTPAPALAQEEADSTRAPVLETPVTPDSLPPESLRERLQRQDKARYDPELLQPNRTFRDSALAALDSLGLEKSRKKNPTDFRPGFNLGSQLWNYNRVEGFVLAAGLDVGSRQDEEREPWVELQAGYAFGSEKFRHYEALRFPLAPGDWGLGAHVYYGERAVPYGSNRPLWNSIRAFVGGEDARDYLRSRGGGAFLEWRRYRSVRLAVGYEAAEEASAAATTSFALFGDMAPVNDPVQDGTDRAVVGRLRLGGLARYMARLDAEHRVAGGDLGGDFTYNRTDLQLALRRYFWRQEFVLRARYAHTGGDAPVQRLADAGGLSTVRGYKKRAQVGESAFAGRLEYLIPYDLFTHSHIPVLWRLRFQFVPWADAARTWDGATDAWIAAAGLGVQYYLGPFGDPTFLRLDVAFPMGPDRSRDVRLELHFVTGVF